MEKYYPMAIGVIIDVKLYNLAPTKEALLSSIGGIPVGEDLFYLYHPEATVPLEKKGEKIQCIYYYTKEDINQYLALTQTTYILGSERDEEYKRKVIFITDSYNQIHKEQIDVLFEINKAQRFECEYFMIGIGNQNFDFVNKDIKIITLNSIEELQETLNKIFSEEEYNGTTIESRERISEEKKANSQT